MAYAFLSVLKDDFYVNGKPSNANENYSYRLMELDGPQSGYHHEPMTSTEPAKFTSSSNGYDNIRAHIVPRVNKYQNSIADELPYNSVDQVQNENFENILKPVKRKKIVNHEIPDDFQREISRLQTPNYLPDRIPINRGRRRNKPRKPGNLLGTRRRNPSNDVGDEDTTYEDENGAEEEEEVEEKKEKTVKKTIKKKKPFSNATQTTINEVRMTEHAPYRTIVDLSRGAGTTTPYRMSRPTPLQRDVRLRPLFPKENVVDVLDPNYHQGDKNIREGIIRPRDVKLVLKTRHKHPHILIRRYRPYYAPHSGINFFANYKPHLEQQLASKKPCRTCKKRRKKYRRKKYGAAAENVPPCNSVSPSQSHHHLMNPYTFYDQQHNNNNAGNLDAYQYQYSPSQYSPNRYTDLNDFYHEKFPSSGQHLNEYVNAPLYENRHYPSEPFSSTFASTELPYPDKSEYVPAREEPAPLPPPSGGYDVREHESTEELAADHQRETDEDLEDENENPQYDDDGTENVAEYDENEEESNPRWDKVFNFPTTYENPIKKSDK